VPLRHTSFGSGYKIAETTPGDCIASAQEFLVLVRALEESQLSRLRSHHDFADLMPLAETLANGGLLVDSVVPALSAACGVIGGTGNSNTPNCVAEVEALIAELETWVHDQRKGLRAIAEGARDQRILDTPDVHLSGPYTRVVVKQRKATVPPSTSIEVRSQRPIDFALVAITCGQRDHETTTAGIAARNLSGALEARLRLAPDYSLDSTRLYTADKSAGGDRPA
jgi:hypothetical protein